MDMTALFNAPRPFVVKGQTFSVSALTHYEWSCHQAWVRSHVPRPSPPDGADAIERSILRRAWPPAIGTALWWEVLDHPGCFPELVRIVIGKHSPAMGDEEVLDLAVAICRDGQANKLVQLAIGTEFDPDEPIIPRDPDAFPERPESDSMGELAFQLVKALGWTHADVAALTFPQLSYYCHSGKPPRRGAKVFTNSGDARDQSRGTA